MVTNPAKTDLAVEAVRSALQAEFFEKKTSLSSRPYGEAFWKSQRKPERTHQNLRGTKSGELRPKRQRLMKKVLDD